ncbi:MAG: HDOD domain-containing protein [Desulfobacterales bacterium]|nr:HDOD domain-containing protein [Desulfobacterales bacterium]
MANTSITGMIKAKIKSLPLTDASLFEVISLLNDPESNFEQIIEKLSPDIVARFLKMANSAFYGREVRSINYAVRLLGYKKMAQILNASILIDHFAKRSNFENFNFNKFQTHAQLCAAVSKVLGEILDYSNPEDLFTVATLHNIGKLVIAVYFKDEHKKIIALKKSENISTTEAEQRLLSITHAEIGALVLKELNIPQDICDGVRFHHAKNRILPEESNFQLELIARESARIVGDFVLPKEMEPLEIIDRLKETIRKGREMCLEKVRIEMRDKGYNKVFPSLLEQASNLVYRDLKKILQLLR